MELTDCMLRLLGTAKAMDVKWDANQKHDSLLTYCHQSLHVMLDISQKIKAQHLYDAGITFSTHHPIPRQLITTISRASNIAFPSLPQTLPKETSITPLLTSNDSLEQSDLPSDDSISSMSFPNFIDLSYLTQLINEFNESFQQKRFKVWNLEMRASTNLTQNIHSLQTRWFEEYVFHFKLNDPTRNFSFNFHYKTLPPTLMEFKHFLSILLPGILPFLHLDNLPNLSLLIPHHLFPVVLQAEPKPLTTFVSQVFNLTQNAFLNHENPLFRIPFDDTGRFINHQDYPLTKTWKFRYNPTHTPPYHYTYPLNQGYLNIIEQGSFNKVSQDLHATVPYVFIPSTIQNIIIKRIKKGMKIQGFVPWGIVYINAEPLGYLTDVFLSVNLTHSLSNEILASKQNYATPLFHSYGIYHGSSFLVHKSLVNLKRA